MKKLSRLWCRVFGHVWKGKADNILLSEPVRPGKRDYQCLCWRCGAVIGGIDLSNGTSNTSKGNSIRR